MRLVGHVRDGFPRVLLLLPANDGSTMNVEFIVDTGFDGDLTLPGRWFRQLEASSPSYRDVVLADGTLRSRPYHEISLELDDEVKLTEILEIEGNPLLGVSFLAENLLQIEITDGGEVLVEPL